MILQSMPEPEVVDADADVPDELPLVLISTFTISTATTEHGAPLVLGSCAVLTAICSAWIWRRYTWKAFVPVSLDGIAAQL